MKILLSKMKCYYSNIGEKSNGIGIANIIKISSLYNMYLVDIAEKLRIYLKTNFPSIKTIRWYTKKGLPGIYAWDTIIIKPQKNFYYVIEGNHRILSLILLKEKYLEVNRTLTYINKTPTKPKRV